MWEAGPLNFGGARARHPHPTHPCQSPAMDRMTDVIFSLNQAFFSYWQGCGGGTERLEQSLGRDGMFFGLKVVEESWFIEPPGLLLPILYC